MSRVERKREGRGEGNRVRGIGRGGGKGGKGVKVVSTVKQGGFVGAALVVSTKPGQEGREGGGGGA